MPNEAYQQDYFWHRRTRSPVRDSAVCAYALPWITGRRVAVHSPIIIPTSISWYRHDADEGGPFIRQSGEH